MALTKIDDRGLKTPIDLLDDEKIRVGTGNDLEIYHDGSKNIIKSTNGNIEIDNNSEYMARFLTNGAVELYNDNGLALKTDQYGIIVTAPTTSNASTVLIKGFEAKDAQLLLQADEADDNADTHKIVGSIDGSFYIQNLSNGSTYETNIKTTGAGNVELYYDNVKKLETTSAGVTFTGDTIVNGSGDTAIRWALSGTNKWSIYHNTAGSSNHLEIFDNNGSGAAAKFFTNGAVELYYDNVKTFETHSLGIKVIGDEGGTAQIDIQPDQGDDNADKWKVGATDSGHFFISNKDSGAWDTNIECNRSGNVELYYDGSKKFETTTEGAEIHGRFIVQDTGSDTIFNFGSGSNYIAQADDQATIFRNRSGTERSQIDANGHYRNEDNIKLVCGTGQDLEIYHDSNHSYIKNNSEGGTLYLQTYGENSIKCFPNGSVELFHDASKKVETISTGVNITGGIRLGGNNAANELDDYEEGSWTPNYSADSSTTLSTSGVGKYIKIGNQVIAKFTLLTSNTDSVSGEIKMTGLPFTSANDSAYGTVAFSFIRDWSTDFATNLRGSVDNNATTITLYKHASNANESSAAVQGSDMVGANAAENYMMGVVTYTVA